MCGRFTLFRISEALAQPPGVPAATLPVGLPQPRYNIAPTQPIAVYVPGAVRERYGLYPGVQASAAETATTPTAAMPVDAEHAAPEAVIAAAQQTDHQTEQEAASDQPGAAVVPLRWGLPAPWKKASNSQVLFNARAETLPEKLSFASAFAQGRCIIPCDGYYEWRAGQPYFISGPQRMWFAGVCTPQAATVVTTAAVGALTPVHHRMPRILDDAEVAQWLDSAQGARELLQPRDPWPDQWQLQLVSRAVNTATNEGPELIVPIERAEHTHPQPLF